jgi:hypothetical protein
MVDVILETFHVLVANCTDPAGLADDYLAIIEPQYELSSDEWLEVTKGVRDAVKMVVQK